MAYGERKQPVSDETLGEVLHFDPLAYAEKVTEKSYKEDKATEFAGLRGHIQHGALKRKLLEQSDDSAYGTKVDDYLRIIDDIGFEQVYEKGVDDPEYPDNLYRIFVFRQKGILLAFDSYWNDGTVNGGNFHYQIILPKEHVPYLTSSSSPFKRENGQNATAGYHDCREAIRYNIRNLDRHVEWIVPWENKGIGLYLLSYMDWRKLPDYDKLPWKERSNMIAEINRSVFEQFPEDVKQIFRKGFEE